MLTLEEAREQATQYMKDREAKGEPGYAVRSCWKCNGAHEHLRKADYPVLCFACGHWWFMGVDLTPQVPPGEDWPADSASDAP